MDIDGISPRMLDPGFYNMDCMDGMAQFPDKYLMCRDCKEKQT